MEMFSDPMKLFFSYSHHFNWIYCLKNLQIFFRKVALTAILFFHVVVVLSRGGCGVWVGVLIIRNSS